MAPPAAWSVLDLAMFSRPEPSTWNSTSPQRSAAASERRSRPSRIICSRARSIRARLGACGPVSFLRRLPWWTRWIRAVALTAARASAVRPRACFRGLPCSLINDN